MVFLETLDGFWTVIGSSTFTMDALLHVQLVDEGMRFCMMTEVLVHEENVLRRFQERAHKE